MARNTRRPTTRLPVALRSLFWEYDFRNLTWKSDRELITARVQAHGDWDAIQWLRAQCGDSGLRDWLVGRQGGGLQPRQLRFWEVLLDIPHEQVSAWLADQKRSVWDQRRG
jgi:hypothetical protein